MAGPGDVTVHRDVVCPFCALACDDLAVEAVGDRLEVVEGGCGRGRTHFEAPPVAADPAVAGRPVPLAAALARAGELLAGARAPLFAGLGADVAGVRAALALADRLGGSVDHLGSDGLFPTLRVLQDAGAFATTLSEVRARADLMLIVGPDPLPAHPRLVERCFSGPPPLADDPAAGRRLLRLGPPGGAGEAAELTPCEAEDLPAAVATLRALARGAEALGAPAELAGLVEALRAARYPVVAWSAGALPAGDAELVVEGLLELVRELNVEGRCAGLPLGGDDGLTGANQVTAWQTGLPLRTGFARGWPEHDPWLLSAGRRIAAGEVDALVWISAFREVPPPETAAPTILLGVPGAASAAEVFVPVATPGVEAAGQLFRMDGSVALPLRALRATPLPTVAAALEGIAAVLPDGEAKP